MVKIKYSTKISNQQLDSFIKDGNDPKISE